MNRLVSIAGIVAVLALAGCSAFTFNTGPEPYSIEALESKASKADGAAKKVDDRVTGKKRVWLCIAGANEEHTRDYLQRIEDAGFPMKQAEFVLQVGARLKDPDALNSGDGLWPYQVDDFLGDRGESLEEYVAETMRIRLQRAWAPRPFKAAFYDYEPKRTLPNGGTQSWMWQGIGRGLFEEIDADVMTRAVAACRAEMPDIEWGFYGLPNTATFGDLYERMDNQLPMMPLLDTLDYHQLNLYPSHSSASRREIRADNRRDHYNRVTRGYRAQQVMAQGKPIYAIMWPRWGMDNEAWFEFYLHALQDTDIDTIIIWVNPHNTTMSRVYASETIEAIPALKRWMKTPLRP